MVLRLALALRARWPPSPSVAAARARAARSLAAFSLRCCGSRSRCALAGRLLPPGGAGQGGVCGDLASLVACRRFGSVVVEVTVVARCF